MAQIEVTLVLEWSNAKFSLVDGDRGVLDVEWSLILEGMSHVVSSLPELYYCFNEGATLDEMLTVEPIHDHKWSRDDENYSILEKWCGDVINWDKDVDDLPLHRLRRRVIDAERWLHPDRFRDCPDCYPYYVYDDLGRFVVAPR